MEGRGLSTLEQGRKKLESVKQANVLFSAVAYQGRASRISMMSSRGSRILKDNERLTLLNVTMFLINTL